MTVLSEKAERRFVERFVVADNGCFQWIHTFFPSGYGRFATIELSTGLAHRAAWMQFVGPIAEGLTLDHLCRNRGCVNPDHLEPVTSAVNTMRGNALGAINARKVTCDLGHEFTWRKRHRVCLACEAARHARYHQENPEAGRDRQRRYRERQRLLRESA